MYPEIAGLARAAAEAGEEAAHDVAGGYKEPPTFAEAAAEAAAAEGLGAGRVWGSGLGGTEMERGERGGGEGSRWRKQRGI